MSSIKLVFCLVAMLSLFFLAMKVLVGPEVATKRAMADEEMRLAEADDDVEDSKRDLRSAITLSLENHGLRVIGSQFDTNRGSGVLEAAWLDVKMSRSSKIRSRRDLETAISRVCESHGYEVIHRVYDVDGDKITRVHVRLRPIEDE